MLYFDTNGGETMIGIEAEKGRYINSINTPKRQGYLFAGWLWNNQPVELPFKYDGEAESIVFLATWIKDPTHTHTKTVYRCITCDLHYGEFIEVLCKEKGLKSGNAYRLTVNFHRTGKRSLIFRSIF